MRAGTCAGRGSQQQHNRHGTLAADAPPRHRNQLPTLHPCHRTRQESISASSALPLLLSWEGETSRSTGSPRMHSFSTTANTVGVVDSLGRHRGPSKDTCHPRRSKSSGGRRRLLHAWLGSGFWLAWLACQRRWGFAAAGCALCVLAPGICICPCRCDRRTAVQPLLADRGTVRSRRWA